MQPLVECVPNFSNGRDPEVYGAIADAIRTVPGVQVFDVSADPDHNRTVITFVGAPDDVVEAAFQGIRVARDLIDLDHHRGEHPRIGATDVCPFVPVSGITTEACVALARRLGKDSFFKQVNGGSPADITTFARPDVCEAVLTGSDVCLTRKWSAHEAFTRECIGSEKDWSAVVRGCTVPVVLLQADQDPQTPVQTIRELMGDYPHLDVRFLPDTGQLLFFAEWAHALEQVELMATMLPVSG